MAFWEWAAAGAVFVAIVVMCARFMNRGLTTLEDERAQCLEKIRQIEEKIKENDSDGGMTLAMAESVTKPDTK